MSLCECEYIDQCMCYVYLFIKVAQTLDTASHRKSTRDGKRGCRGAGHRRRASRHCVHVHWYRYLCQPVNHVKVVWFVVGFYGGELKRSFRHRHSAIAAVLCVWVILSALPLQRGMMQKKKREARRVRETTTARENERIMTVFGLFAKLPHVMSGDRTEKE